MLIKEPKNYKVGWFTIRDIPRISILILEEGGRSNLSLIFFSIVYSFLRNLVNFSPMASFLEKFRRIFGCWRTRRRNLDIFNPLPFRKIDQFLHSIKIFHWIRGCRWPRLGPQEKILKKFDHCFFFRFSPPPTTSWNFLDFFRVEGQLPPLPRPSPLDTFLYN